MFQAQTTLSENEVFTMSPRLLAHLGDAVFHLYERERELLASKTASQVHKKAARRVSASGQAKILSKLSLRLTESEMEIVRRARNMKSSQRHPDQAAYRLATAFEALLGYLYLTNRERLTQVLLWTLEEPPAGNLANVKDRL